MLYVISGLLDPLAGLKHPSALVGQRRHDQARRRNPRPETRRRSVDRPSRPRPPGRAASDRPHRLAPRRRNSPGSSVPSMWAPTPPVWRSPGPGRRQLRGPDSGAGPDPPRRRCLRQRLDPPRGRRPAGGGPPTVRRLSPLRGRVSRGGHQRPARGQEPPRGGPPHPARSGHRSGDHLRTGRGPANLRGGPRRSTVMGSTPWSSISGAARPRSREPAGDPVQVWSLNLGAVRLSESSTPRAASPRSSWS